MVRILPVQCLLPLSILIYTVDSEIFKEGHKCYRSQFQRAYHLKEVMKELF